MARLLVVDDLNYKDKAKHVAHVEARIEVWKKGYGLLCDVEGVLYVYAPESAKKTEKHKHIFKCECGKVK